jgi:argininosuccinate lyase
MVSTRKPISRSGRFAEGPTAEVQRFSESVSFDARLYRQDIAGSIAHATMLAQVGILTRRERDQIVRGLKRIEKDIDHGRFRWKTELEDVHMNIESVLTRRVPAGAKLHTGRSRNDQVATDLRLWVKDVVKDVQRRIRDLQRSLLDLGERTRMDRSVLKGLEGRDFTYLPIPGYTHLQRAQPVLVAHHLLAYVEMLHRDYERFGDCSWRADFCPLGSGALAGSSLPLDRQMTSRLLGFREPCGNSMDAVSDRDFVVEFLFTAALTGVHLSRLAEDLIIWSSSEFGFVTIGDTHTTGSSLMPHKKNPDVAELGRGKSARLLGNLVAGLTLLKGLPMTYNRDLQEDKPPLFDSADTLLSTLSVFASMMHATRFNPGACVAAVLDPNLLATELADYLVRRGVPFREAHHAVGAAVRLAEKERKPLYSLKDTDWRRIHRSFGKDVLEHLHVGRAFQARSGQPGSPSPEQVRLELQSWKRRVK